LARKQPTAEQCIHIALALRSVEAWPTVFADTAIEIGVFEEHEKNHESWVVQTYGSSITVLNIGSEWSHGHDHYTRYSFHVEASGYIAQTGQLSDFESVLEEIEWSGYKLYTKDESPH
jgi:hypothetical protein